MDRAWTYRLALFLAGIALLPSCGKRQEEPSMSRAVFGTTPDGREAYIYTLRNSHGMEAKITNFGATLVSLSVPDRDGKLADVVLGYDSLAGYVTDKPYFGGTIGRYANRIARGKFSLGGIEYQLPLNDGPNTLHGGTTGFNKVLWDAREELTKDGPSMVLTYLSKDGEQGYPGALSVTVAYTLTDSNALRIEYTATTDKPTIVNLTNHSYFNLAGQGNGDILGTRVMINADQFTPVDSTLIPTGELRDVRGTPMDFTQPTPIGARINDPDEQLKLAGGYDHNWVLNGTGTGLSLAATAYDSTSGRELEVSTTEPGIQFYTGNFLDGTVVGKGGKPYLHRYGFCLETQHFPDSPNKPGFPTTELKPGETFHSETVYQFTTK